VPKKAFKKATKKQLCVCKLAAFHLLVVSIFLHNLLFWT